MDIKKFLDLSAGKWFSQRTSYLDENKAQSSKADLTVELLASDDSTIVKLCEQARVPPQLTLGGVTTSWDNSVDWGKPKQIGSALIVIVPNADNEKTGKLLSQENNTRGGHYILGEDGALTLTIETDRICAEERQWFASDNLRLRTVVVKDRDSGAIVQTAFYSEIRKAPAK